jgi:hypothetical protein
MANSALLLAMDMAVESANCRVRFNPAGAIGTITPTIFHQEG